MEIYIMSDAGFKHQIKVIMDYQNEKFPEHAKITKLDFKFRYSSNVFEIRIGTFNFADDSKASYFYTKVFMKVDLFEKIKAIIESRSELAKCDPDLDFACEVSSFKITFKKVRGDSDFSINLESVMMLEKRINQSKWDQEALIINQNVNSLKQMIREMGSSGGGSVTM